MRRFAGDRRLLLAAIALGTCVGLAGGGLGAYAIYSRFGPNQRVVNQFVTSSGPSSGATLTITAIAQQKAASVVQVVTQPQSVAGLVAGVHGFASGFAVSADGLIVTSIHAVRGATLLRVSTPDGHAFPATIVRADAMHGVVLLRAAGAQGLSPLTIAAEPPKAGDLVLSVAHPPFASLAVTTGTVSSTGRSLALGDGEPALASTIAVDATADPAGDGAPLLNGAGEVVGVVVSAGSAAPGVVALSAQSAAGLLARAAGGTPAVQPTVGADVTLLDPATAASAGCPPGALIVSVVAAGPAATAGLLPLDVVTALDGTPIDATHPFDAVALGLDPEQQVTLTVWRARTVITLTLKVGSA